MTLTDALGLAGARMVSLVGAGGKTSLMFALAREGVAAGERVLVSTTTKIASDEAVGPWPAFAAADAPAILRHARARLGADGGAVIAYSGEIGDGLRLAGFGPPVFHELLHDGYFRRMVIEADGAARKPLKAAADYEPVVPAESDALIMVAGLNGLGRPLDEANLFRPEIWARLTGQAPGAPVSARALARMAVIEDGLAKGCPPRARRILFLNRAHTPERQAEARLIAQLIAAAPGRKPHCLAYGWLLPAPEIIEVIGFP